MNPRILLSVVPVVVFLVLTRVAPPLVAISGAFATSGIVFYINRRDRLIGALTTFGFVVVAASALVGIVWNSEKAYLASGPISDFLFIPLYFGSIAIHKPLIGGIARELFPAVAGKVPIDTPVYAWLSVLWAGYDLVHGIVRFWMLSELSVSEYVIWSRITAWPVTTVLLLVTGWLIHREAERRSPSRERDEALATASS